MVSPNLFYVGQEPLRILPPSHTNVYGDRHDDVHPTQLQARGLVRHHPCPSEEYGGEVASKAGLRRRWSRVCRSDTGNRVILLSL